MTTFPSLFLNVLVFGFGLGFLIFGVFPFTVFPTLLPAFVTTERPFEPAAPANIPPTNLPGDSTALSIVALPAEIAPPFTISPTSFLSDFESNTAPKPPAASTRPVPDGVSNTPLITSIAKSPTEFPVLDFVSKSTPSCFNLFS